MTYTEREKIFSKECLNIEDLQELFEIDYNSASILMRDIKRKSDRLGRRGKLHIQDYFDYFELDGSSLRYSKQDEEGNSWRTQK